MVSCPTGKQIADMPAVPCCVAMPARDVAALWRTTGRPRHCVSAIKNGYRQACRFSDADER
jgi:hypothetical protein